MREFVNIHAKFFDFLNSIGSGDDLQVAYRQYKNSSFELNGRLKSGLPLGDLEQLHSCLRNVICAKVTGDILLYRMTSRHAFNGPLLNVIESKTFRDSAFMSTSINPDRLHSFTPAYDPLVLKITCPSGTVVALMEANPGASEDEFLLGCGTEFEVGTPQTISDLSVVSEFVGQRTFEGELTILPLTVVSNPPYTSTVTKFFEFECEES